VFAASVPLGLPATEAVTIAYQRGYLHLDD
jgi:hypothetical protein